MTDGSGLPQGSMTGEADRLGKYCTAVSVFLFCVIPNYPTWR